MKCAVLAALMISFCMTGPTLAGPLDGTYSGWIPASHEPPQFPTWTITTKGTEAKVVNAKGVVFSGRLDGNTVTFASRPEANHRIVHTLTIKGTTADYFAKNTGSGYSRQGTLTKQ